MITITKKQAQSLADVLKLPKPNMPIPIMTHALIDIKDGKMIVKTTDMNIEMTRIIDVDKKAKISTAVSASKLSQAFAACSGDIILKMEKDILQVKAGRKTFKLSTMDPADFPLFPEEENMQELNIASDHFTKCIKQVMFSAGMNDVRYYLNGVNVSDMFAASDGHRAAWIESDSKLDCNFTIHRDVVPFMPEMENGRISYNKNALCMSYSDYEFKCKFIDGKFPDLKRLINTPDKTIKVDKLELIDAVKSAMITADGKSKRIIIHFGKSSFVKSQDQKQSSEIEFDCDIAEEFDVAVNAQYLIDSLNATESDTAEMRYIDSASQIYFLSDGLKSMIMPVRL